MNISKELAMKIGSLTTVGWTTLGFYRGCGEYNYNYNKKVEYYKKELEENRKIFLTKNQHTGILVKYIMELLVGYLCPMTIPWIIVKEIYRLEANLRNIEDEKKTEYYNTIM